MTELPEKQAAKVDAEAEGAVKESALGALALPDRPRCNSTLRSGDQLPGLDWSPPHPRSGATRAVVPVRLPSCAFGL